MGIIPCRFTTLDMLRVESYLLFYPYDNSQKYPFADEGPGDTLWELGLDFTVSPGKTGFRGAEEHYRLKGKERFKIFGVLLDGKEPADEGAPVYAGGKQVGVVTCAMYSPLAKKSMGIARLRSTLRSPARRSRSATRAASSRRRRSRCPSTIRRRPSARRKADRQRTGGTGSERSMIEPTIKSRPVYGTLDAPAGQGPSLRRRRRRRRGDPRPREGSTRRLLRRRPDRLHPARDRRPIHRPRCRR